MTFDDTASEAELAIQDMVEAIAQEIFATPIESRNQAMDAIGRSLLEMFNSADAAPTDGQSSFRPDNAALIAALNLKISARVTELDSAFDTSGHIKRH
jgi:hypothetical protein